MDSQDQGFYLKTRADYEKFVQNYKKYDEYNRMDDNLIMSLIEAGIFSFRQDLLLMKSNEITNKIFKSMAYSTLVKNIKILVLEQVAIDDKALIYLSKNSRMKVETLKIINCVNVENKGLSTFFGSAASRNLRNLHLEKLGIENSTLVSLINNHGKIKNLNSLTLIELDHISNDSLNYLYNNNFRNLKTLKLDSINFTNGFLYKVGQQKDLISLESLTLARNSSVESDAISTFFDSKFLQNLKYLEIEDLQAFSGPVISSLSRNKYSLREVKFVNLDIEDSDLIKLSDSGLFNSVVNLTISDCSEIENSGLVSIFTNPLNSNFKCITLEELKNPSKETFNKVFSYQGNAIQDLKIMNCTDLTNISSSKKFLATMKLAQLRVLNLESCNALIPEFFQTISKIDLLGLNELVLPIGDELSISFLAKSKMMKNVKKLVMDNCVGLTNKAFEDLVKSKFAKNLELLSVRYCSDLNDDIADYFVDSKIQSLKEFYLAGVDLSSEGVDRIIYSPKFATIEKIDLTDGSLVFPALYKSEHCVSLKSIEGNYDGVSKDDIINIFSSTYLNEEFDFSDMATYISMDDDIIMALANSKFLRKVLYLPLNDTQAITADSIVELIKSQNLHPFFDIDSLIKETKTIINDQVLISMAENPLCVNNLYEIDLQGTKGVTEEGIIKLLTSPHLSAGFKINDLLESIRYKYEKNPAKILTSLKYTTFAQKIKDLILSEYFITDDMLTDILVNPSPFPKLKKLFINETKIEKRTLETLINWDGLKSLTALAISEHKKIEVEVWEDFFHRLIYMELNLKYLELEFNRLNNKCIEYIVHSPWANSIVKLGISGCTLIDFDGLKFIIELREKHKTIDLEDIYEDFKHFFIEKEDGSFELSNEVSISLEEVMEFLSDPEEMDYKQRRKKMSRIRDTVIQELSECEKLLTFNTLDLHNSGITSKSLVHLASSSYISSLRLINLNDTTVEDNGIEALAACNSLFSLEKIKIKGCYLLGVQSLVAVLEGKFSPKFNPDNFVTEFAEEIETPHLENILSSKYHVNMRKINLGATRDLGIEDLNILFQIQKQVDGLMLNCNLSSILANNKSEVNDELLTDIAESNVLSTIKHLDLTGSDISSEGLKNLILSPFLHPGFALQPLIDSFSSLVDDNILNAISRSRVFRNVSYIDLNDCPKVTNIGLMYIVRSPNKYFEIQKILDDNGESIDSHFIKTIVQQDYFENLTKLCLKKCTKLKSDDLIKIIENLGPDFQIESIIYLENIPAKKGNLITDDVIKAITQSKPYIKHFIEENSEDPEYRRYFEFNIRLFRNVNYGINYLIEEDTAPHEDYDDYIQHYLSVLNYFSLKQVLEQCRKGNEEILSQMKNVARLDFGQNDQLYSLTFKNRIVKAFDSWQSTNCLNLEKETLTKFANRVIDTEYENTENRINEDEVDELVANLLYYTPNVEELILSNQNIGDTFLKNISIFMDSEEENNLPKLRVLRIRNNLRYTAIGLKFLYVTSLKRKNLENIDVFAYQEGDSGITYFVNNGLYGLMDYYLVEFVQGYKISFKRNRYKIIPFLFDYKTLRITFFFVIGSGAFAFHIFEKLLIWIPRNLGKCFCCCTFFIKKIKGCLYAFAEIFKKQREHEETGNEQQVISELLMRYRKIQDSLKENLPKSEFKSIQGKFLFYFDEAFYTLNVMLSGRKDDIMAHREKSGYMKIAPSMKSSRMSRTEEEVVDTQANALKYKSSFVLLNLKFIFLFNFIVYYGLTFPYQIVFRGTKCEISTQDSIILQIPYFIYALCAFLLEFLIMFEVSRIIGNPQIVSWKSPIALFSLVDSLAAKYDFFTDINYILQNKNCKNTGIFAASTIIIAITLSLNLYAVNSIFRKIFLKREENFHSTKFINLYSKLCFVQEMYGVGKILDRFSTSSATKFQGWYVPKFMQGVYIPLIIVATFQRLLIEDIPQLIVQLAAIFALNKNLRDFNTLTALLSTVINLFLTLHTAWKVKPSYFSRNMFKVYHDITLEEYKKKIGKDDVDDFSESASELSSSFRVTSSHRDSEIEFLNESEQRNELNTSDRRNEEIMIQRMEGPAGDPD